MKDALQVGYESGGMLRASVWIAWVDGRLVAGVCGAKRDSVVLVMPGPVGVLKEAVIQQAVCVCVCVVSWEVG